MPGNTQRGDTQGDGGYELLLEQELANPRHCLLLQTSFIGTQLCSSVCIMKIVVTVGRVASLLAREPMACNA